MRYETRTVAIGEWTGPLDLDREIPFEIKPENLAILPEMEAHPERFEVTTDGGWPRVGWKPVLRVGMYDGWPYWRPVPTIMYDGTLGPETTSACHFYWRRVGQPEFESRSLRDLGTLDDE